MSVRESIYSALSSDAQLKSLSHGVYHRRADKGDGNAPPFVIFFKSTGNPLWSFGGPPMDKEFWTVKGVGTAKQAEAIDKRCREVLDGATLAIAGKVHQDLRHMADVNYQEVVDEETVDHIGAEYKVDSEAT